MIGIVVVSHSYPLASAAVALASEMVDVDTAPIIEIAAGLDKQDFGTDAVAVANALNDVAANSDGVLVLMDVGSAILSTQTALEFCEPEVTERVQLSTAPLVEGLLAAVVTASGGTSLDEVAEEVRACLVPKRSQIGEEAEDEVEAVADESGDEHEVFMDVSILNPYGLHARPAARLVRMVSSFDARVRVTNLDTHRGPVPARSLSRVSTLGAEQGHRLRFGAQGPHAEEALAAIKELAAHNFGDTDEETQSGKPSDDDAVSTKQGSGLRMAIGPAVLGDTKIDTDGYHPGDVGTERGRLDQAVETARRQLRALGKSAKASLGTSNAEIFRVHAMLLDDEELVNEAYRRVEAGDSAPAAWQGTLENFGKEVEALPSSYHQARAQDVDSLLQRLLAILMGRSLEPPEGDAPGILVVDTLDPAVAVTLDPDHIHGVVTVSGGASGHGVIIARSRGIPIYPNAAELVAGARDGSLIAFDWPSRRIAVDPDETLLAEFTQLLEQRKTAHDEAFAHAAEPATTTDGTSVAVLANLVTEADAWQGTRVGADGWVVRTEFLFGRRDIAPTREEQAQIYARLGLAEGRRIIVRTWDVGGDKTLPFLPLHKEANPFLGVRGLRVFREHPQPLIDQVDAVCQAAHQTPVSLMFPMVSTLEELEWALALVEDSAARTGGRAEGLRVGIMVEVPAAALLIGQLSKRLDFVSIGTSDLMQYTMAAERGNAAVRTLADPLHPAVLRMVQIICDETAEGTLVGVCGDAANDPDTAAVMVGLGVREVTATVPGTPMVKAMLRRNSLAHLQELAQQSLTCTNAAEVKALLRHL